MSNETKAWWHDRATAAAHHAAGCEVSLNPVELGNPCARYAKLELPGMDGEPICARLVVPAGEGPHPATLMFHDANRGVRGWHHMTRFVALGRAVVALQNRAGTEAILAPEPLAVGDGLGVAVRVPTCPEPPAAGRELSAAAAQAFEATLSDALVLASALPRVVGLDADDVITWGEGLGAGLALAVAALTGVRAACALNPLPAVLGEASARCDVALVARGLACPVLMGSCGLDLQASPLAQDAVAAGLQDVRRIVYPRYGHERVNAFEDEMLSFLVSLEGGRP